MVPTPAPEIPPSARAEADFTRLFNLSLDLIAIAGLDGYFKRVNPSWTRVLGWSEAELLARPVADFMHPEDRERTLAARAGLARGVPVTGLENRYRCKDGSHRWLSWQSVTAPGDTTVFAVARDITERRELEQERLMRSKLESNRVLAGGMAHDFNNLLAGLALNLDMIPFCGPLAPEQQQHLELAREVVQSAKRLTARLIVLADGRPGAKAVCDLTRPLQDVMAIALGGSGVRHECRVAPGLWPVEIDEPQILQVIHGLLLNAREATPAGGTVIVEADNVPVAAGLARADAVRIRVTDTGPGIPGAMLPKVFDPYFSTKERGAQKGMGLTLATCRVVLEEHGGRLTLESRPGAGTTVTCLLAAARSEARNVTGT